MTLQELLRFFNEKAPFSTAESWDNVGLLVGTTQNEVRRVTVALDATPAALEAARQQGAELLITHHPVIFSPLRTLELDAVAYQAAAAGIGVLSLHTNLDKATGGVNDTLAARLGLTDVRVGADGMTRIGQLTAPTTGRSLAADIGVRLRTAVRVNGDRPVRRVAVCGGSGGELIPALASEADAFVTGEVRHHEWLMAQALGLTVLEAGHYATELPVVETLRDWLAAEMPRLAVQIFAGEAPYDTVKR